MMDSYINEHERRRFTRIGVSGGLIAGLVVLLALMIFVGAVGGPALGPIRYLASMALGPGALVPGSGILSTVPVIIAGLIVHLVGSALGGMLFAVIIYVATREHTISFLAPSGVLYGIGLWLFIYFILRPILWPWLPSRSPASFFLIYALVYGLTLGIWVGFAIRPLSASYRRLQNR